MRRRTRRGFALLAATVLLALASALVVGTFSLSRALRRAATTTRARARVETGVTRAFGEVLQGWSGRLDSLPAGASVVVTLGADSLDAGLVLRRRVSVSHVDHDLYAVTVDVCALDCAHPLAQRRARLWLRRSLVAGDSAPPAPVTSWALSDLY